MACPLAHPHTNKLTLCARFAHAAHAAACALMALKDGVAGWAHRPTASAKYRSAEELLDGERTPAPWDFLLPRCVWVGGGCVWGLGVVIMMVVGGQREG